MGAVAKPGGDAGDFMVALAALRRLGFAIEPGLCNKVLDAAVGVRGGVRGFSFHTDDHALYEHGEGSIPGRGCGHLKQASSDPHAYGLIKDDIGAIVAKLAELKARGAKEDMLRGDHREGAVLVIESDDYSVRPSLAIDGEELQAFVYQKARHNTQLLELSRALFGIPKIGKRVTRLALFGALTEVSGEQLNETLRRLAKGLPMYAVTFDPRSGEAQIEKRGYVGAKTKSDAVKAKAAEARA